MSYIEQFTHLINGLRTQTKILLDASGGGLLRLKIDEDLKILIENMF